MSAHTPTPWAWTEGTPTITHKWNGKENPVATVNGSLAWHEDNLCSAREAGANAALIVRAVNRDHHFDALVKALEFYANPNNWIDTPSWDGDPECITPKAVPVTNEDGRPCDCGDTARAALDGLKTAEAPIARDVGSPRDGS